MDYIEDLGGGEVMVHPPPHGSGGPVNVWNLYFRSEDEFFDWKVFVGIPMNWLKPEPLGTMAQVIRFPITWQQLPPGLHLENVKTLSRMRTAKQVLRMRLAKEKE